MANIIRLDKYISDAALVTRSEAVMAVKKGLVSVNGTVVRSNSAKVDADRDTVTLSGRKLKYSKYIYVMLNKPEGYVSATEDGREHTVIELLPSELQKKDLFPAGRLDKNTVGLMLLTNDGDAAHKLLSPKHHVSKKYFFRCRHPLSEDERLLLEAGAVLDDGYVTKPSVIELLEDRQSGYITLTEGKYHQIKRMLESVNNKITYLERVTFGELLLDPDLERGAWRYLTDSEISSLSPKDS